MKHVLSVLMLIVVLIASVSAQDTVYVKAGWNIIGSVKAGAIPDILTAIPDSVITASFYGYTPGGGYQTTDTLGKGLGYWVKVKADGIIVFKTTPALDACRSKAFIYQGRFYNTVAIGDQCWMAENLDFGTMVLGDSSQTNNGVIEKYCYNDDPVNCVLYGGLYQWDEAMQYSTTAGAQGICPSGWHIPTLEQLQTLSTTIGGDGNALKAVGQGTGVGAGTNMSGFSALLAGDRINYGYFFYLGIDALMWSSSEGNATNAGFMYLDYNDSSINLSYYDKNFGFSVRCLKD